MQQQQLGAALDAEQLVQPAAEGAARQPTAAAIAAGLIVAAEHAATAAIRSGAATKRGQPAVAATTAPQQRTKGLIKYIVKKIK